MKHSATGAVNVDTGPETAQEMSQGRMHKRQPSPQPRCEHGTPGAGISIDEMRCLALIDTGYLQTIVDADQCQSLRRAGVDVNTIGGTSCACCSVRVVSISIDEGDSAKIDVLVVCGKPLGLICCWESMQ